MSPPQITPTAHPTSVSIPTDATYRVSKNVTVSSNSTVGMVSTVPLLIKSAITSNSLTIKDATTGSYNLNVDNLGNFNTLGAVAIGKSLTSNSIFVADSNNNQNFTVSDAGVMTLASDATISGKMTIAKDTRISGQMDIAGETRINTNKIVLGNSGEITAKGDLQIGDFFKVSSDTGAITVSHSSGDLNIGQYFRVHAATGAVHSSNTMHADGNLTIGDYFSVESSSGNFTTSGTVTSGSITVTGDIASSNSISTQGVIANDHLTVSVNGGTKFNVDNTGVTTIKGDVNVNGSNLHIHAADGHVETGFSAYDVPDSVTDMSTTSLNQTQPSTTCTTSQYLSTQQYVDDQIWAVKKRVHDILGTDETTIASFNHVYELVAKIEGTPAADVVGGLVDQYSEVKVSVSDVIARSYNIVPVNCSSTVFADECPPLPTPATVSNLATGKVLFNDGWYIKNYAPGNKANWYMPANGSAMKLSDIKNLYLNVFAVSDVSLPFITVYTRPTGTNDLVPGFCHARINYLFASSTTSLTSRKAYCLYTNESPVHIYNENPLKVSQISTLTAANASSTGGDGSVGNSIDTRSTGVTMDDIVGVFCINTDSKTSANNVEFVLNGFNVELVSGTTKHVFSSASAMTNYMTYKSFGLHHDLSKPTAKAVAHFDTFDGVINAAQQ
jgi:hypothetical protein